MRKGIGVILLIGALFFLSISLQFVMAQEDGAPSTEIEIVEDGTGAETPVPEATTSPEWKPGTDSGNADPFTNLIDPKGKIDVDYTPPPTLTPPPTKTPEPGENGDGEDIVVSETPEPTVTAAPTTNTTVVVPTPPTKPQKEENIATGFNYTGVLWNGYQHIAIITSSDKSYIARVGDELGDGFVVLYVGSDEVILVKEGQKSTLKIQEVD